MEENLFYLTADQLTELQVLVWGAKMTNASEPKRYADLIKQIKDKQGIIRDEDGHIFLQRY